LKKVVVVILLFKQLMSTASVFVNVVDELISKVSDLETELAKMHNRSGESLTLYTSYCTSVNTTFPIRFHTTILVIWPTTIVLDCLLGLYWSLDRTSLFNGFFFIFSYFFLFFFILDRAVD